MDDVPFVLKHSIAQCDLFVKFRFGHLLQVLQVRVEQVAAGQRNPQNRLDDITDGAVVRQTDLLCSVHEVTATGPRAHLQSQALTHTEASTSSRKPEVDWSHLVVPQPLCGFNGSVQAGLADVHVLSVGVLGQQLHQGPNVHIVVVVHMAEPLFPRLYELVVLDGHLAG